MLLISRQQKTTTYLGTIHSPISATTSQIATPDLGTRLQLNYQQWLDILNKEAKVTAQKHPANLSVLAGDSITMWFPTQLLPKDKTWLNQGISGETTDGLLKRLDLFDDTQPQTIFVMIGINDLIRGVSDEEILNHQQQIIVYLHKAHPQSQIVVQSILPHAGEETTWEGRDKLLAISNNRIQQLNQQLQAIAAKQGVKYYNLYPLFADKQGNLRTELTTDGLHLNHQGYLVWETALQLWGGD